MRISRSRLVTAVLVAALAAGVGTASTLLPAEESASAAGRAADHIELKYWPEKKGDRLEKLLAEQAHSDEFAVFDADNTIWRYDLEESLLPYLEMKGVISRETLDPSLKLMPFREGESLYSYYVRLCEIDDKICYPWIAQAFSGLSLGELKKHVDDLFARDKPIPVTYYEGDEVVHGTVKPPRIYPAQRELINRLQEQDITVYVMTAALEELVRMVVSDPTYGIGVAPEKVIGVTTLLKDPETGELTTSRKQIEEGHFLDEKYPKSQHERMILTPYLWSPTTWYVGKSAAIKEYIDPENQPILVAGDAPSDWFMLFESDVRAGGLRLWVNRKQEYTDELQEKKDARAKEQKEAGVPVDAKRNWLTVKPREIGG